MQLRTTLFLLPGSTSSTATAKIPSTSHPADTSAMDRWHPFSHQFLDVLVPTHFPHIPQTSKNFPKLPKTSENFQKLQKTSQIFCGRAPGVYIGLCCCTYGLGEMLPFFSQHHFWQPRHHHWLIVLNCSYSYSSCSRKGL